MVPIEAEDGIICDGKFMTKRGRQHAERYAKAESMHPRQDTPYKPRLIETAKIDDDGAEVLATDLVAPGHAA